MNSSLRRSASASVAFASRSASSARLRAVMSRTTETDPMMFPEASLTGVALTCRWRSSPVAGVRMISSWLRTASPLKARRGGVSSIARGLPSGRRISRLPANSFTSTAPASPSWNSRSAAGFSRVNRFSVSQNQTSSRMLLTSAASLSFCA